MNREPKIGERVRYRETIGEGEPWAEVRETTGVVERVYRKRALLNEQEILDDDEAEPRYGALLPPSEWQAAVKVDKRPAWWPYPNNDAFAPSVACLEPEA